MLQLQNKPHEGEAKDGEFDMSLGMPGSVVGVERLVGGRAARTQSQTVGRPKRLTVGRRRASSFSCKPSKITTKADSMK